MKTRKNFIAGTKQKHGTGFTLVELLITLSIIGLLAALLSPALRQAREQTRKISCMSNLRQIGIAFHEYATDNDGQLPTIDQWRWYGSYPKTYYFWAMAIQKYVNNPLPSRGPVFDCPSHLKPGSPIADARYDYTLSANCVDSNSGGWGKMLSSFTRPEATIAVFEDTVFTSSCHWSEAAPAASNPMWTGHLGKSNCLMVDGHVESFSYDETNGSKPGSHTLWYW